MLPSLLRSLRRWARLTLQGLGLAPSKPHERAKEGVALALWAWLPFATASVVKGLAIGALDPYFLDLALHARFLLAVPLVHTGSALSVRVARGALRRLANEGAGPAPTLAAFEVDAGRWMSSRTRAILLGVVSLLFGQALFWGAIGAPVGLQDPVVEGAGIRRIWVHWIAFPIFYLVGLRALLSWLAWCRILGRLVRVPLRLSAAHPDYAGGIEFMARPSRAFCLAITGFACILAADWAAEIAFEGVDVSTFGKLLAAWASSALIVTMGPLFFLSPHLLRTRIRGLREFGALSTSYTQQFEERWIRSAPGRPLLGTSDLQSLADLGNSFRVVREMRVLLIRKRDLLLVLLASAGPALPLLLTKFPMRELLERIFMTMAR